MRMSIPYARLQDQELNENERVKIERRRRFHKKLFNTAGILNVVVGSGLSFTVAAGNVLAAEDAAHWWCPGPSSWFQHVKYDDVWIAVCILLQTLLAFVLDGIRIKFLKVNNMHVSRGLILGVGLQFLVLVLRILETVGIGTCSKKFSDIPLRLIAAFATFTQLFPSALDSIWEVNSQCIHSTACPLCYPPGATRDSDADATDGTEVTVSVEEVSVNPPPGAVQLRPAGPSATRDSATDGTDAMVSAHPPTGGGQLRQTVATLPPRAPAAEDNDVDLFGATRDSDAHTDGTEVRVSVEEVSVNPPRGAVRLRPAGPSATRDSATNATEAMVSAHPPTGGGQLRQTVATLPPRAPAAEDDDVDLFGATRDSDAHTDGTEVRVSVNPSRGAVRLRPAGPSATRDSATDGTEAMISAHPPTGGCQLRQTVATLPPAYGPPVAVAFDNLGSKAGLKILDDYLLTRSYIMGYQASEDDTTVYSSLPNPPSGEYVNVSRWYNHINALLRISGISGDGGGVTLERKASEERAAAAKASGMSSILLDVKPWGDETDMKSLEEAVRSVQMEGLVWGESKLVPVGYYGIEKLQIMLTIVDKLVSVDDLVQSRLTEVPINEYVQSCDIVAFNKNCPPVAVAFDNPRIKGRTQDSR